MEKYSHREEIELNMPTISQLRSDFHFDTEYTGGHVPLTEVHNISDYESQRLSIAVAAGAGVTLYKST